MKHLSLTALISVFLIVGCGQPEKIILESEHLSSQRLEQSLIDIYPELESAIKREGNKIILDGRLENLDAIVTSAQQLDMPVKRYRLTLTNHAPGAISSRQKSMQLTLSKGHKVILGSQMLMGSPWEHYSGPVNNNTVSVILDEDLSISLAITDTHNNQQEFIQGTFSPDLNEWTEVSRRGGNRIESEKSSGSSRKIISTAPQQALWMKLDEIR